MAVSKSQIETARKAFIASKKTRDAEIKKTAKLWHRWQNARKRAGLAHLLDEVAK
jgi:hypothetical protein